MVVQVVRLQLQPTTLPLKAEEAPNNIISNKSLDASSIPPLSSTIMIDEGRDLRTKKVDDLISGMDCIVT
jgi:hypothetical protein